MRATIEAIINRAQFKEAVARGTRSRSFRLGRGTTPGDTLLYRDGDVLVVDAPLLPTRLPMIGEWPTCVSVEARMLALLCPKLRREKMLSLLLMGGTLIIDNGVFQLPAKLTRAP